MVKAPSRDAQSFSEELKGVIPDKGVMRMRAGSSLFLRTYSLVRSLRRSTTLMVVLVLSWLRRLMMEGMVSRVMRSR